MATALGVAPDDSGVGVDPLTHRQIIKRHWTNTGAVGGLSVTGQSNLQYAVSAGMAVCSMGDADGYTEAYWPGGVTENAVSAGDATYGRIDTVYMLSNTGSPDNLVHVMVQQGSPAASPAKPALPTGGIELASMLLPAGATATSSASAYGSVNYAIAAGASVGLLGESWQRMDGSGSPTVKQHFYEQAIKFTIPTDRVLEFTFKTNFSASDSKLTEWAMQFQVDGTALDHSAVNFVSNNPWQTHETSYTTTIQAGTHTALIDSWLQNGAAPNFHYNGDSTHDPLWIGRRFQIWDLWVAR